MTDDQGFERRIVAWLEEEAVGSLPDRVFDAAFAQTRVARRPARPFAGWVPNPPRFAISLIAVGATAIVVAVIGAALVGRPLGQVGATPVPTTPLVSSRPAASAPSTGIVPPQGQFATTHDGGLVFAFDSLWIGDQGGVQRIDPATNGSTLIATTQPVDYVSADGIAVYADTSAGSIRIDPSSNQPTSIKTSMPMLGSTWSMDDAGTLHRYDPTTGAETGHLSVQGAVSSWPNLTSDFGSIWIASGDTHTLIRVDPTTLTILATIDGMSTEDSLWSVGTSFGSVWVQVNAALPTGLLYRIDPATNTVIATILVGDSVHRGQYGGTVVAFSPDSVWTADAGSTVSRVDASTNRLIAARTIDLSSPEFIAYGAGSVWVRNQNTDVVERLDAAAWGP